MSELGLSLEETSRRLKAEYGVDASPASISNWTHGRLPRRTKDCRRLVEALEYLLRRTPGEMQLLLERDREERRPKPKPKPVAGQPVTEEVAVRNLRERMLALAASDSYAVTAVDERVLIGADRREYQRTVRLTVRALNSYTDCYRLVYSPDDGQATSKIRDAWNCRRGRELRGERDLAEMELLFDRVLDRGATHTFDYVESVQHCGPLQCWARRGVGHSEVAQIRMVVRFAVPPARVWACRWNGRDAGPVERTELAVVDHLATLELAHPTPGLHGIAWSW